MTLVNEITGPLGYCQSKGDFPWHEWIAQVKVADLDHSSSKSPYSDFTQQVANVSTGQTYSISLTTGFSYDTWDEYWSIWIDFNQDGDFIDDGEKVFRKSLLLRLPEHRPMCIMPFLIFHLMHPQDKPACGLQ